ncbi:effector-associated constant component EACC1 [Streptomyces sp. NBC_00887]|uniref:effector-associated constant component EACC1 n=1 Tax=Streptomyces sp. NBC_00887 TaxID=2975859 RepID=UPI002F91A6C3|nr:hypothetical protein OG844_46610 [Streptomyces sp. NBC_00887]
MHGTIGLAFAQALLWGKHMASAPVAVGISIPDDPAALPYLRDSLRRHPATRRLALDGQARQTGGGMDALAVLNIVLEHGAAYGSLAVALAARLDSRRNAGGSSAPVPTNVTLSVNGATVSVSAGTPEDLEHAIRTLAERGTLPPGREAGIPLSDSGQDSDSGSGDAR